MKEKNVDNKTSLQVNKETIIALLTKQNASSSSKEIAIEDFIDFDKSNLAEYRILYTLFGKSWYWFYNIAAMSAFLIMILGFSMILFPKTPNYLWLLLNIPGILSLFYLIKAYRKRLAPIVNRYNSMSNIKIKSNYNIFKDKLIILKIQNSLFSNYIKTNYTDISTERLSKIIEALKYESSNVKYIYQSLTISISLLIKEL